MASTNKTTNLELSQYVSSDKPTYLVDYNSDMAKIDTGVHTAQVTADTASTAATNAQTTAETAQTTANTAVTNAAAAQSSANGALNNIGNLANLTTAEKNTLVGAINEVDGDIGNLASLSTSDKTSVVNAINSIETKIDELDNYSITETLTGAKWKNNKPIYRICVETSGVSTNSLSGSIDLSGIPIEDIVKSNIYEEATDTNNFVDIVSNYYQNSDDNFRSWIRRNGTSTVINYAGNFGSTHVRKVIGFIEYTKSTD